MYNADAGRDVLSLGRFFGTPGPVLSGGSVHVSISRYSSHDSIGTHAHERPYLSFVLKGDYSERVGRRQIDCVPLTARFHPAGEEHSNRFGQRGGCLLNIELAAEWSESVARLSACVDRPSLVDSVVWIGLRVAEECVRGEADAPLAIECLAAALLDECERRATADRGAERHRGVRRAMELIDDELDRPLSLPRIAAVAGLHPTHFARTFRRLTGRTVCDFVRDRRVARAQRALTDGDASSLSAIAAEIGFADHAHFTRTFRAATGEPPSAYRARVRRLRSQAALI
jgi:AraC family transcriptional regulator